MICIYLHRSLRAFAVQTTNQPVKIGLPAGRNGRRADVFSSLRRKWIYTIPPPPCPPPTTPTFITRAAATAAATPPQVLIHTSLLRESLSETTLHRSPRLHGDWHSQTWVSMYRQYLLALSLVCIFKRSSSFLGSHPFSLLAPFLHTKNISPNIQNRRISETSLF